VRSLQECHVAASARDNPTCRAADESRPTVDGTAPRVLPGRTAPNHAREPIEIEGGTVFHFVTDGFDAAYAQTRETAGEDGVGIAGGASTVRQALVAGVVDELTLDITPILLGSGERIFDGFESLGLEPVEVLHSPLATHIRHRRAG
jgi:dihydrofolate reductase